MNNRLVKNGKGIIACFCALLYVVPLVHAQYPPGGINLLDGYRYKQRNTFGVLSAAGTIFSEEGLLIEFEEGMNVCCAADPADIARYAWFKEQVIAGRKVYIALIKKGVKTVWEPDKPRNNEFGNILLVTYPLGGQKSHGINFVGEILSDEELADALLMILTFDPNRVDRRAAG